MNFITNETRFFGSFSDSPGNNGANFFNMAFQKNRINAIYLPMKCEVTEDALKAMRIMNFCGAAFSKPHKTHILSLLDSIDSNAQQIGAVNTVVVKNGKFIGYNTDWFGVYKMLEKLSISHLFIYGKGGFSKAVQFACNVCEIEFSVLSRPDTIPKNSVIFNATPIEIASENTHVIDGRPTTETGKQIFLEQAKLQYKLYTGVEYE
jgi:shikimate 5-dehydrogenase